MNCPSRVDPIVSDGHNQNPNDLASDLTTRSDFGRIASARLRTGHRLSETQIPVDMERIGQTNQVETEGENMRRKSEGMFSSIGPTSGEPTTSAAGDSNVPIWRKWSRKTIKVLRTYCSFIGPGFMISVAYIDPGNYATDVAAGASYRFKLLFMILLSNIFAIFLQSLCIHLGTVTGMNLAQMTRAHCPRWLNYVSYFFGESAIIATDIAEVIGTAIALNLLSNGKIPLVAGVALSIVDVLFILMFFRQDGASMTARRVFEFCVGFLVFGVVICFCVQLSFIQGVSAGEVFRGYVPSSALVEAKGLYQACGILGATVMPHSLYLGSGLVQERLRDFDRVHKLLPASSEEREDDSTTEVIYKPSLAAIKSCKGYSIAELAISLFTFALFVNSAILITAGASLSDIKNAADASLFGIYDLLSNSLAPAAGTLFAVALLLSGTSAGIICTIAGQMVSEGQLNLTMRPWLRRLLTRSISITPSIIVAGALGSSGMDKALVGSQVALSVILPFVSAPLVWFTCRSRHMTVTTNDVGIQQGVLAGHQDDTGRVSTRSVNMRVHPITAFFAVVIWGVIVVMNVALLVLLGLGKT